MLSHYNIDTVPLFIHKCQILLLCNVKASSYNHTRVSSIHVIVKERHETIMGYKPRERVALEWFIPIIVELLVL